MSQGNPLRTGMSISGDYRAVRSMWLTSIKKAQNPHSPHFIGIERAEVAVFTVGQVKT
ncbi:hypothetical protein [Pseudomonas hormoni]|nr:hypothetical protein [Pseudomonas sp.]